MTPSEYLATKTRMLLAAEAAGLVARTGDTVRFDEEMYPLVLDALANNKSDVRRVLAECDILRSMSNKHIFPQPPQTKGIEVHASRNDANDTRTVDALPEPPDEVRGPEVPPVSAGDGGPVQAGGADGAGSKRPKPRRNRKGTRSDSQPLG